MRQSNALVRLGATRAVTGTSWGFRLPWRGDALAANALRYWLEPLEARLLRDATAGTVALDPAFGQGMNQGLSGGYTDLTPTANGAFFGVDYQGTYRGAGFMNTIATVRRFGADGGLDPTFTDIVINRDLDSLLVTNIITQADGKLLVVVRDAPPYSPDPILVLRYNGDGTADSGFGDAGQVVLPCYGSTPFGWLTGDGKIDVIRTDVRHAPGDAVKIAITQLNADGSPDAAFGADGERDSNVVFDFSNQFLAAQPSVPLTDEDGVPIRASWNSDLAIALPTSDGGAIAYFKNVSFGGMGTGDGSEVTQVRFDASGNVVSNREVFPTSSETLFVTAQPDGKALVLEGGGTLTRIGLEGQADPTFGTNGSVMTLPPSLQGRADFVTVQDDGKLLVVLAPVNIAYGYPQIGDRGVERLDADGSVDSSFDAGEPVFGFQGNIMGPEWFTEAGVGLLGLADGSTIVSRSVYAYGASGSVLPSIVKLLPSGGVPNTFDPNPPPVVADPVAVDPGQSGGDGGSSDGSDVTDGAPGGAPADPNAMPDGTIPVGMGGVDGSGTDITTSGGAAFAGLFSKKDVDPLDAESGVSVLGD